jgi:hypothetical protein
MYHSLPPFTYIDQGTVFTRQVLPDRMHVGAGVPKRKRMVQKKKKWSKKKNGQKHKKWSNKRNGPTKEFAQRIVISTLSKNTYPI